MNFSSSYQEVRKIEGSRNRDSTVFVRPLIVFLTPVYPVEEYLAAYNSSLSYSVSVG